MASYKKNYPKFNKNLKKKIPLCINNHIQEHIRQKKNGIN